MSHSSSEDSAEDPLERIGQQLLSGNRRAVARALTIVERGSDPAETLIETIYPHTGSAHRIGVTGPPGAGKSSLVNALAKQFRARGQTVAILAVDPTSPFTGGALLGDRVRMNDLYGDKGIFIRSMASRGQLGGLAQTTQELVKVFDAAGFDIILIETVGAGQAEVDIAALAHTTLVVEAPGLGDDIQSIKAGILEIADILVLNKADRPGAQNTRRAMQNMLQLGQQSKAAHHGRLFEVEGISAENNPEAWQVPIRETVAIDGSGVEALTESINEHLSSLKTSQGLAQHNQLQSQSEIENHINQLIHERWQSGIAEPANRSLIQAVANRKQSPRSAARIIFNQLTSKV